MRRGFQSTLAASTIHDSTTEFSPFCWLNGVNSLKLPAYLFFISPSHYKSLAHPVPQMILAHWQTEVASKIIVILVKMVKITMIAHGGFTLVKELHDVNNDQKEADFFMQEAKTLVKHLSNPWREDFKISIKAGLNSYHCITEGSDCYLVMIDHLYPREFGFQYLEDLKNEFKKVRMEKKVDPASRSRISLELSKFIQVSKEFYLDSIIRLDQTMIKLNYSVKDIETSTIQEVLTLYKKDNSWSEDDQFFYDSPRPRPVRVRRFKPNLQNLEKHALRNPSKSDAANTVGEGSSKSTFDGGKKDLIHQDKINFESKKQKLEHQAETCAKERKHEGSPDKEVFVDSPAKDSNVEDSDDSNRYVSPGYTTPEDIPSRYFYSGF